MIMWEWDFSSTADAVVATGILLVLAIAAIAII
jgi:hypothetical protein